MNPNFMLGRGYVSPLSPNTNPHFETLASTSMYCVMCRTIVPWR